MNENRTASRLRVERLRKKYKSRPVVKDVSFDVGSGEVIGLLGPNGAGKTTCFYMIVGLVSADGGETPRPVMMLVGGGLRVALVTIHRPLATVVSSLSAMDITEIGGIVGSALMRDFGIAKPRIGLCGVNPHAGEDGEIGREEIEIINPAAALLRSAGLDISDARPGDTIFHEMLGGRFDAVLAMYHDQGLIPVKTLDMWGGVNVTLGLPFIRTSPDHGVAYDAAAAGIAKADSLIAAVKLADQMAHAHARSQ